MITKLLVANRGEIARRIFRTCQTMGIGTVAVYSDADANAAFVGDADMAVPLGGSAPSESYLKGDAILAAALAAGADAIHPGYGFLSENSEFARAVMEAGLVWIGPPPEAIDAMGSKIEAKRRMAEAAVPLLPSVELTGVAPDRMVDAVSDIGYPILVKASAGGGGRGMRVVHKAEELVDTVTAAVREAESAFGDGTVYAEKFVAPSKHVEVQIFGDSAGNVVHLGERECSVQRRHQKVIEEAPSPSLTDEARHGLHQAAVAAGRAIGYVNAGTVEFLLAPDGSYYFLEVNTRLQVEHPVTEAVTGMDLVRLQLEVGAGGSVPDQQDIPDPSGHSIEARVYAEDPRFDYRPSVGEVTSFAVPEGVRVDAAFDQSGTVTPFYDAMIAKVISHAPTRPEAARRLAAALKGTVLVGIDHNLALLVRTLLHPDFANGGDTELLERLDPADIGRPLVEGQHQDAALMAAALADQAMRREANTTIPGVSSGFRNVPTAAQHTSISVDGQQSEVQYRFEFGRVIDASVDGRSLDVTLHHLSSDGVDMVVDGIRKRFDVAVGVDSPSEPGAADIVIQGPEGVVVARRVPRFSEPTIELPSGSLVASMPGTIRAVNVEVGDVVEAGQSVVVMEAMKMELSIDAPSDGTIQSVSVAVGETVDAGAPLVVIA